MFNFSTNITQIEAKFCQRFCKNVINNWIYSWSKSRLYRVPWLFHALSGWAVAEDAHTAHVSSEYAQSLLLWRHRQRFVRRRAWAGIYCKHPQQPEDRPSAADWPAQCTHHAPKKHALIVKCTNVMWNVSLHANRDSHLRNHVNDLLVEMTGLFLWVGGSRQSPG